jgi:hypothetical protein
LGEEKMIIKLYNLETEGLNFKSDFNKYERIKKISEERTNEDYIKIDLISKNNKLYLCKRYANFKNNEARTQIEEITGFKKESETKR